MPEIVIGTKVLLPFATVVEVVSDERIIVAVPTQRTAVPEDNTTDVEIDVNQVAFLGYTQEPDKPSNPIVIPPGQHGSPENPIYLSSGVAEHPVSGVPSYPLPEQPPMPEPEPEPVEPPVSRTADDDVEVDNELPVEGEEEGERPTHPIAPVPPRPGVPTHPIAPVPPRPGVPTHPIAPTPPPARPKPTPPPARPKR
jgi:hypothetical protein